ncbi:MAG: GNAT family N-acetyltransferase [Rhizobiaceae bacterium]|nr:GNAT family N-acetyltransferase [Rhizobiaceae bacterium]
MSGDGHWREMRMDDVASVFSLAERVHPTFPETIAIYPDRMALYPMGCIVLDDGQHIVGYGLAYPARLHAPPPLGTVLGALSVEADALYVHDVAVAPEWRGRGQADAGIARLLALPEASCLAMLVSVYGTSRFWTRFGFVDETTAILPEKLASYGEGARYMVRRTAA